MRDSKISQRITLSATYEFTFQKISLKVLEKKLTCTELYRASARTVRWRAAGDHCAPCCHEYHNPCSRVPTTFTYSSVYKTLSSPSPQLQAVAVRITANELYSMVTLVVAAQIWEMGELLCWRSEDARWQKKETFSFLSVRWTRDSESTCRVLGGGGYVITIFCTVTVTVRVATTSAFTKMDD